MDSSLLISLRPDLKLSTEGLTAFQAFQNSTLRPILKMLNEKICSYAHFHIPKLTKIIHLDERRGYVTQFFNKNPQKARFLQGLVCGYFIDEEFAFYLSNDSDINKRIKELIIERIATSGPNIGFI